eukprot:6191700-Pleurochrysis_carterae.AAC.1
MPFTRRPSHTPLAVSPTLRLFAPPKLQGALGLSQIAVGPCAAQIADRARALALYPRRAASADGGLRLPRWLSEVSVVRNRQQDPPSPAHFVTRGLLHRQIRTSLLAVHAGTDGHQPRPSV